MKKIVAAGAVAAALLVGTAAPASAIPRATKVGQTCQAYKQEIHADLIRQVGWTYEYKLINDTLTRCTYILDKTNNRYGLHERSTVSFNKYRY